MKNKKNYLIMFILLCIMFFSACNKETSEEEISPEETFAVQENTLNETSFNIEEETTNLKNTDEEQSFVAFLQASEGLTQLIVVSANGSNASVSMHEKTNGIWKEILSVSGYVGASGVGTASEESSTTPRGLFSLPFAFGQEPDPGTALPYTQVNETHFWVDDSESAYYNQLVSTATTPLSWNSAEHLADASLSIPYAYAIFIGYNLDCVPGRGSAFFLHCSNNAATAGCVSVDQNSMIFILNHIQNGCKILIDESLNINNN